jgi:hypothetical protein
LATVCSRLRNQQRQLAISPTDATLPAGLRPQGGCHALAASLGAALLTPKALLGSAVPASIAAAAPHAPPLVAAIVPSVLSAYSAGEARPRKERAADRTALARSRNTAAASVRRTAPPRASPA